ncbi:MAG: dockerin type I domain-containing protein [Clostridia bacterium]
MKKVLSIFLVLLMFLPMTSGLAAKKVVTGEFIIDLSNRDALSETKLSGSYTTNYYEQLDDREKFLYNARVDSIPVIRQGDVDKYKFDVPFDITVNAFIAAFFNAAYAFDLDKPEIFWLNKSIVIGYSYTEGDNMVVEGRILKPDNGWYNAYSTGAEVRAAEETFNRKLDEIIGAAPDTYNARVKYFHDFLINNNTYNAFVAEGAASDASPLAWSAASALIGNPNSIQDDPVCEGYARAYKVLLDRVSTPCALVVGLGNNVPHMWTYVKMQDNKWYGVDVTWDDPYGNTPTISYTYYLRGAEFFLRSHIEVANFTNYGAYAYPILSLEDYVLDEEFILGDANMDGVLNSGDAGAILQYCASVKTFTEDQMKLADFNKDDSVSTGDASAILAFLAFGV